MFGATIFLSAFLMFIVEPMIARMVLPLLGGAAAVWTTCLVFFQAVLLCGYAYAHGATTLLGPRRHAAVHIGVVLLPLLFLPVGLGAGHAAADRQPGRLAAADAADVDRPALLRALDERRRPAEVVFGDGRRGRR